MINKNTSVLLTVFLLILIVFDAFQQKFYIDTFSLGTDPISLGQLLQSHAIRWFVWLCFSLPFGWVILKQIKADIFTTTKGTIISVGAIAGAVFISVATISYISIVSGGYDLTTQLFIEFFTFLGYQKGLMFFMAYCTVILLVISYSQTKKVEDQSAEITSLRKESAILSQSLLQKGSEEEKRLTIKTGNRVDSIPLKKIIWIQADDYCVKIHTERKFYSLRKSMKLLEKQLRPFRFVRIHRGALLNLQYLDQVNFETSTIRLQNESELPLSQRGMKTLKREIKEAAS